LRTLLSSITKLLDLEISMFNPFLDASRYFPLRLNAWLSLFKWSAILVGFLGSNLSWAQATNAETLFKRIRPSVVVVRTEVSGNLGLSSSASGFIAHRKDWVVTNYHAVTEAIYEAKAHNLTVQAANELKKSARVIAVDVHNDLAILQLDSSVDAPLLELRETLPAKGENGFSVGKPGSFEYSIVNGSFNGMHDEQSSPLIVFSGAINSGMSGGPTIDTRGQVVGVNVATSTQHQLIGLVIPSSAVSALIKQTAQQSTPDNAQLRADISRQFAKFGRQQLHRLDSGLNNVRKLGPFNVRADLADQQVCFTERQANTQWRYSVVKQTCESASGLYVMDEKQAGRIVSGSFLLQGPGLNDLQMANLVERRLYSLSGVSKVPDDSTPWQCKEQRVKVPWGLTVQLHACRRALTKLPNLNEYRFRYTPLVRGSNALVVAMGLDGFDDETAKAILSKSMSSLAFDANFEKVKP
jgi:S1-C subfamily serine protease